MRLFEASVIMIVFTSTLLDTGEKRDGEMVPRFPFANLAQCERWAAESEAKMNKVVPDFRRVELKCKEVRRP